MYVCAKSLNINYINMEILWALSCHIYSLFLHNLEPNDSGNGEDCTEAWGANQFELSGIYTIHSTVMVLLL